MSLYPERAPLGRVRRERARRARHALAARRVGLGRRRRRHEVARVAEGRLQADRLLELVNALHQLLVVLYQLFDLKVFSDYVL